MNNGALIAVASILASLAGCKDDPPQVGPAPASSPPYVGASPATGPVGISTTPPTAATRPAGSARYWMVPVKEGDDEVAELFVWAKDPEGAIGRARQLRREPADKPPRHATPAEIKKNEDMYRLIGEKLPSEAGEP